MEGMDGESSTPSMLSGVFYAAIATVLATLPLFLKPPDAKYKCVNCNAILRPPVKQTMCGHRLCELCVPELFTHTDTARCPGDDDCVPLRINEIHPDVATTKELLRMSVYCSFKDNGCKATPKWSRLKEHEDTCEYATVQCHNPGCNATLLRSTLKDHEQACEYLPILCELCEEYVPKKDLHNGHEKMCSPKAKKCSYSDVGCTFEGTPDKLKHHVTESTEIHNKQLLGVTSKVNTETTSLKEQVNDLVPKVNGIQAQLDAIQLHSNDKKIQGLQKSVAKLSEDITNIGQQLDQKAEHNDLAEISSKFNDIQTVANMHESRIGYLEQGSGGMSEQTMRKINQMETSIGAYDIRLAEYDIRFRLLETAAYNGQMIWKITNYRRRKRDAEDGRTLSLYSQPFYTSYYGYKLCARAYLNGDGMGRGTHLSLFFVVMRGEYDALLPWPFRPKVTLALLDQSGSRRHVKDTFRPDPTSTSFRRPISEMNIASGSPMFAAHSTVESDSYLRDDTIFIRVTIDQSDMPEMQ